MLPIMPGGVSTPGSTAMVRDGEVFLRLLMAGRIMQIAKLDTGETVAAVEQRMPTANCLHFGNSHDAAGAFAYAWTGNVLTGRVDRSTGVIAWNKPVPRPMSPASSFFATDDTWGFSYGFSEGAVRTAQATSPALNLVYTGAPVHKTASSPKLFVWSVWETAAKSVIKAVYASSVRTLVSHDTSAVAPAISSDKLVWIGVRGANAEAGEYTSAEILYSALPTKPEDVVVQTGPTLSAKNGLTALQSEGDFAASIGDCNFEGRECALFVGQLSTKKSWRIPHRPMREWATVLTVSPSEIVLAEADPTSGPGYVNVMTKIVRLKLSALDGLTTAW